MLDLSVVIVNFRAKDNLRITLASVFASKTKYSYEVFVVDNDSGDGSVEMIEREFSSVKLVRNINNGFSKGNNAALRQVSGRLVLILNPDTRLNPDVLQKCVTYLDEQPDIGALTCKVVRSDGSFDKASRRSFPDPRTSFYRLSGLAMLFPRSRRFAAYNLTFLPEDLGADVDSISGCFMLMPRQVLEQVGLFDEEFFMYGEDLDLCLRIKRAGYRVYYYPATTVVHYKGQSSKRRPLTCLWHFHNAMWIFYKKHYADQHVLLFDWVVYLGIKARLAIMLVKSVLDPNVPDDGTSVTGLPPRTAGERATESVRPAEP